MHAIQGTSGLHTSLAAIGVGPGDEVIVPGLTVVMDAYAAIHLGAKPIFAEVDRDTFLVTSETIKKNLKKNKSYNSCFPSRTTCGYRSDKEISKKK